MDITSEMVDNMDYRPTFKYAQKEVPNVSIDCLTNDNAILNLWLDSTVDYYEEYDLKRGWKIMVKFTMFSPETYKELTNNNWVKFIVKNNELWWNDKTGKNISYVTSARYFNHISIHHNLNQTEDPSCWTITLYNTNEK